MKCPFCGDDLATDPVHAAGGRIKCSTCHALIDPELMELAGTGPSGEGESSDALATEPPGSATEGGADIDVLPGAPPADDPFSTDVAAAQAEPPSEEAPAEPGVVQIDDFQVEPRTAPPKAAPVGPARGGSSYSFRSDDLSQAQEAVFVEGRRPAPTSAVGTPAWTERPKASAESPGPAATPGSNLESPFDLDEVPEPVTPSPGRGAQVSMGRDGRDAPFSKKNLLVDEVDLAEPLSPLGRREHPVFPEFSPPPRKPSEPPPAQDDGLDVSFDGLESLDDSGAAFDGNVGGASRSDRGPDFDQVLRPEGVPSADDVFGGFQPRPKAQAAAPHRTGGEEDFDIPLPPGWDELDAGLSPLPEATPTLPPGAADGFGETLFGGSDRLELDLPASGFGGDVPPGAAPPPAVAAGLKAPKPRKTRRINRTGPAAARLALLMLVLVALVGVILGQTRYGYFGMNLFSGKGGGALGGAFSRKAAEPGNLLKDTREVYEAEARRLERILKQDPDQPEVQATLFEVLLRYRDRFPLAVSSDPMVANRLRELQPRAGLKGQRADLARVLVLAAEGRIPEARGVLDSIATANAQDPEVLYLYGRLAFQERNWTDAQKYFGMAAAANPEMTAARHFLTRALIATKDYSRARAEVDRILAKHADHLGAQVSLAEIALAGGKLDEAVAAAASVVNRAKAGADAQEQFQAFSVLARVEEARGNLEGRMIQLRAALNAQPTDEGTAASLGRLLLAGGKRGEAIGAMRPCRERGCNSEEFLLTFAEAAFDDEQDDVANAAIGEGVTRYPESPRFANLLGEHELEMGRVEAATLAFQQAITVDPKFVPAYRNLAKARARAGRMSEAAEVLQRGVSEVPTSVELLLDLADVQVEQRDLGGAESTLRNAIRIDGRNVKAQRDLGRVLERLDRFQDAVGVLAGLQERGVLDREGTLCLGRSYLALGQSDKARSVLAKLHSEDSKDADASSEYGRALGEAGDVKAAESVLDAVILEHPQNALSHYYRGILMVRLDRFREAVDSFQTASNLKPRDPAIRLSLARAQLAVATPESRRDARQQLDTVIAAYNRDEVPSDSWDADAWALRGRMLLEDEKYPQALKDFEAALVVAPTRIDVLVDAGRAQYEMSRFDDAVPLFRKVLDRDARNPDAHYYLGRISVRKGDTKAALKSFEAAVERDPARHPDAHRMLGMIYRDLRLSAQARKAFLRYLQYVPTGPEAEEVRQLLARMN